MSAFVQLVETDHRWGRKASTLGRLAREGFAVPAAFALRADAAQEWETELPHVLSELGGATFAVRSSAQTEDGPAASFAGQFPTRLEVPATEVAREIRRTLASGGLAAPYASALRQPPPERVAVIVQRMLDPQAAGVAFTRHPVTGARVTVVEAVRGLGEPLVSGQVSPPPAALTAPQRRAVARVAERVEALLGAKSRRPAALAPRVHHSAACRARRRSLVAGGRVSPSPMGQSQRARAGAGALASPFRVAARPGHRADA